MRGFRCATSLKRDRFAAAVLASTCRMYGRRMSIDWDWTRVVIDHVHIRVRDAKASVAFYKAVLEQLGIPPIWEGENGAQLANLVVTDGEPTTSGPVHIAFVADSREQVDAFHRAGIDSGARDNGAPGVREQYTSPEGGRYYAAFLLDPDSQLQTLS